MYYFFVDLNREKIPQISTLADEFELTEGGVYARRGSEVIFTPRTWEKRGIRIYMHDSDAFKDILGITTNGASSPREEPEIKLIRRVIGLVECTRVVGKAADTIDLGLFLKQ